MRRSPRNHTTIETDVGHREATRQQIERDKLDKEHSGMAIGDCESHSWQKKSVSNEMLSCIKWRERERERERERDPNCLIPASDLKSADGGAARCFLLPLLLPPPSCLQADGAALLRSPPLPPFPSPPSFHLLLLPPPRPSASPSLPDGGHRLTQDDVGDRLTQDDVGRRVRGFRSGAAAKRQGGHQGAAQDHLLPSDLDHRNFPECLAKSTYLCSQFSVRLGWHDAGTYDKNIAEWPKRGGANGSLRFEIELKHAANAGLVNALKLLQSIRDKYSSITYADLFQLASATAIEEAGGPKIPMKYGRVDVSGPEQCPEEGRLPDAGPPSPAGHLRNVFYRMGLDDKEIVALSGAHTLGRSRPERSGWGKAETKYTKDGPGAPGGQSWTVQWLKFDNSYFRDIKQGKDEDLLILPTDAVLFEDSHFKAYAEKYAEDQDAFFKDYAEAHAKLSNLGAKFNPPEGMPMDDETITQEPFVAAAYYSDGENRKKD
ncbi:Peroxidase [Musa troglodytarum]|uniref:L-ascorbate peroxidase n=1 Tax=Musa troglodytarum TaxID=320322 RepID=A0A9E7I6A9_9LILI|nr:Peroxidase [Musa troglodytarum]